MRVATTIGDIEHTELEVKDVATWGGNCRVLATEWRKDGELVRRDVHVNVLVPVNIGVKSG